MALNSDETRLLVANRSSGSLSVIDVHHNTLIAEYVVGTSLADLVSLPGGSEWLTLDPDDHSVLLLSEKDGRFEVVAKQTVAPDPVRIVFSADRSTCYVASRWGRCVNLLAWRSARGQEGSTIRLVGSVRLPFSPQNLVLVENGAKLIVADAFGGELAVVDAHQGRLVSVHSLMAHNIRGLALAQDGKSLLVAHQQLNPNARAIQDDIQWGALISSKVRALALGELQPTSSDVTKPLKLGGSESLIELGRFSGDPSALVCDQAGRVILALGGVDQIVMGSDARHLETRVPTGRRPTALVVDSTGSQVFVAESLDDSVSVYAIPNGKRLARISLGPHADSTVEERGERLFYDAKLSRGGWMSCHSCHTDGHSNGLNVDTIGDGGYGAPKRVPSLLGTGTTGPWSWTGEVGQLLEQVHKSSVTTMQGVWPTEAEVIELTAFLRTLEAPRPATVPLSMTDAVNRGRALFDSKCNNCHAAPEYTSDQSYDVGLADEVGHRQFNPPSLRGVGSRAPLLHDGRAKTLEDVFRVHGHPRETRWTNAEIGDLLRFLESL